MSEPRKIPLARPLIGTEEAREVARVLESGWITQGPEVARFEAEFAKAVGAPHAIAVSNCTTALHLALVVAGVRAGDEVVTVSHSYIATANAVVHAGAQPVFVDVDPATFNILPVATEAAITAKTRAILCVHQVGMPCDLAALVAIARRHGLPLIEDAACAIGSEILWDGEWQRIGRPHGDIACFSFHPRKLLSTGDGGMVTTRRDDWAAWLRRARQHAMGVPDTERHTASHVIFETYDDVGWNYRMTDIQAAVGRVQLSRVAEIVARRRQLANTYHQRLADLDGRQLLLPTEPVWARTNWQSYIVRLGHAAPSQLAVMQRLLDRGISTRRAVMCAHREAAYSSPGSPAPAWCPERPGCGCQTGLCHRLAQGEAIQDRGVVLPMYHEMTDDDLSYVISELRQAVTTGN